MTDKYASVRPKSTSFLKITTEELLPILTSLKKVTPKWAPQEIDESLAECWASLLSDFDRTIVIESVKKAAMKSSEWPTPSVIRRLCLNLNQTDEEKGAEISSLIEGAIRKFGWCNEPQAMEFIGEIGQEVVRTLGGWQAITDTNDAEMMSARKQWRDLATLLSRRKATTVIKQTAIEGSTNVLRKALDIAQQSHVPLDT